MRAENKKKLDKYISLRREGLSEDEAFLLANGVVKKKAVNKQFKVPDACPDSEPCLDANPTKCNSCVKHTHEMEAFEDERRVK